MTTGARNILTRATKSTRGTKMLAAALEQVASDKSATQRVTRSYTTPLSQIIKTPRVPQKIRRFPRLCGVV
jgi:hypothetical protein